MKYNYLNKTFTFTLNFVILFKFEMFSIFVSKIQAICFLLGLKLLHIIIWVHLVSLFSSLTAIL
jgi:hypothetical protein